MWGYKLVNSSEEGETVRERYVPDATLSDSRFTLFALGRGDPSNPFKVLEPLEDVIKVLTDLPYDLVNIYSYQLLEQSVDMILSSGLL